MSRTRVRLETTDGDALVIVADRITDANDRCDAVIPLGPGRLQPGLINGHDHLHRNHYPRLGTPPYADVYAWGADLHDRFADVLARARRLDRHDALLFGALKNLLGGATTVVHHDPWEDLLGDPLFPVRVPRVRVIHSLRLEPDIAAAAAGDAETRDRPLCIHLAEGTNAEAAEEVHTLDQLGLLNDRLIAVHVVGIREPEIQRLRCVNAAVVWCPTSNEFLYGRTAPAALVASGADILLGSDSLLTGAGTLLDELRAARALRLLDDARLLDAVGPTAARRLGMQRPACEPGSPADLVLYRRPLFEARPRDIALVMIGGRPVYGDAELEEVFERTNVAIERFEVGGTPKLVAAPLATVAARVIDLSPECGRILV